MLNKNLSKIVASVRAGDPKAFADLYLALGKTAYYIGLRLNKNEHDANDVLQETMLKLYKSIDTLRDENAIKAFVSKTAYNCSIDILRQEKKVDFSFFSQENEEVDKFAPLEEEFVPEKYYENEELRKKLIQAVDELNDVQRAVVLMYYYDNMTISKIADIIEVSDDVVKSRIYRARETLKKKLAPNKMKEVTALGVASPILAKIFETDAQAAFNPNIVKTNWQALANTIGYDSSTIISTTAYVSQNSINAATITTSVTTAANSAAVGGLSLAKGVTAVLVCTATIGTASFGYHYIAGSVNNDSSKNGSSIINKAHSTGIMSNEVKIDGETYQLGSDISNIRGGDSSNTGGSFSDPGTYTDQVEKEPAVTPTPTQELIPPSEPESYRGNYIISGQIHLLTYKKGSKPTEDQIIKDAKVELLRPAKISLKYYEKVDFNTVGEYAVHVYATDNNGEVSQSAIIIIVE